MHYLILIILLAIASLSHAATHTVSTRAQMLTAVANVNPGDTILIPDGVYTNFGQIILPSTSDGISEQKITLKGNSQGGVIFRGNNALTLVVRSRFWNIENLLWENQTGPYDPWESTGSGVDGLINMDGAQDIVVSACTIRNISGSGVVIPILEYKGNRQTRRIHFRFFTIDTITVTGQSAVIYIYGTVPHGTARDITFEGFSFLNRTCNTTQICNWIKWGDSVNSSTYDSGLVILNSNFQFDTPSSNGQDVLHLKAGRVTVRNSLFHFVGGITFRQGSNSTVVGNTFLNPNTSRQPVQIRFFENNHQIINNIFYTTIASRRALALGKGAPDRSGEGKLDYDAAHNAVVINNTFDGFRDEAITWQDATGNNDGPTTIFPSGIVFHNNVVRQSTGTMFTTPDGGCSARFASISHNSRSGDATPGCMSTGTNNVVAAPQFESGGYTPSSSSPLVNAGRLMTGYPESRLDLFRRTRDSSPDIGAVERIADVPPPPPPPGTCDDIFGTAPGYRLCEENEFTCKFNARLGSDAPPPVDVPALCGGIFGGASGYLFCDGTELSCEFNANLSGGNCNDLCNSFGQSCIGAVDNVTGTCTEILPNSDTCETVRADEICICETGVDPGEEPPAPLTCNDICGSFGKVCVGAVNNQGDTCTELLPNADSCETFRQDELCICEIDDPPPPPTVETFYVDSSCGTQGNGTTETCGANGPWTSMKYAIETVECLGMQPGDILEVKGMAGDALNGNWYADTYYSELSVKPPPACSGIIVQPAAGEDVVTDGTVDIKSKPWVHIGSNVYECQDPTCGTTGNFPYTAWVGIAGTEYRLDLIQSVQTCQTSLVAGKMTYSPIDRRVCVHLPDDSNPTAADYVRIPSHNIAFQLYTRDVDNMVFRDHPSGDGEFIVTRYRDRHFDLSASLNQNITIDGLTLSWALKRSISSETSTPSVGNHRIVNNNISYIGEHGIFWAGDTGTGAVIEDNTISEIGKAPVFERCNGVGAGCLSGFNTDSVGIMANNCAADDSQRRASIRRNTIFNAGSGRAGTSYGIQLNNCTYGNIVDSNLIYDSAGTAPGVHTAISMNGIPTGQYHDENIITNNRCDNVDVCFATNYSLVTSQAGKQNLVYGNTCYNPNVNCWMQGGGGSSGGLLSFKSNLGAKYDGYALLMNVGSPTFWTSPTENGFECTSSACVDEPVALYSGTEYFRDGECTTGVNCLDNLNPGGNNIYGRFDVQDGSLQITSTSEARDSGLALPQLPSDYRGVPRPFGQQPDIGAHEFVTGDLPGEEQPENVDFQASWIAPTTRVDGTALTVDDYVLYVCDEPITSQFPLSPSGVCAGDLQTFITSSTSHTGTYITEAISGTLYARVSARDSTDLESDLSEQRSGTFEPSVAVLTQDGFRFYNRFAVNGVYPIAAFNEVPTLHKNSQYTLRIRVYGGADSVDDDIELVLYAQHCDPICGEWQFVSITCEGHATCFVDNPFTEDGTPIDNKLPLDGRQFLTTSNYIDGEEEVDTHSYLMARNQQLELEFSLGMGSLVDIDDTVKFQLRLVDGTALDSYGAIPEARIGQMRGRMEMNR